MKRRLLITKDGSHTIVFPDSGLTYHSIHGAIRESKHVFIEAGLDYVFSKFGAKTNECINVFEMGFGTGLNALLTLQNGAKENTPIHYTTVELHPLQPEEIKGLNYVDQLGDDTLAPSLFLLHSCNWHEDVMITPQFTFHKQNTSLLNLFFNQNFHLIYFDAFAPNAQPELWEAEVFQKLYNSLLRGGVLVTYCCKGTVKRILQSVGFIVEKLPGPPGKREMIRAIK